MLVVEVARTGEAPLLAGPVEAALGDSCAGCLAPRSLLPRGLGPLLSLFVVPSQHQSWVLG